MYTNTTPEPKDSGTTDDQDETEPDCACSALMPCYEHHLAERGRPAIRRIH